MATGVLPVLLGRATRISDLLPSEDKRYVARVRLGLTTDTLDITGTVLERRPVSVGQEEIRAAAASFQGEQSQLPPMYSAVKVGGQRLYQLARQGRQVERTPRSVLIDSIETRDFDPQAGEFTLEVLCSKGTYIRTLCHDLGQKLGCGAALAALRRTLSSGYRVEDSIPVGEAVRLAGEGRLSERVLPLESAFASLPAVRLHGRDAVQFCNGARLPWKPPNEEFARGLSAVYAEGRFAGLARADGENGLLIPFRIFGTD